jgi:LuxR family transcriptional regulator, maltose regulon positive regulatory protein
MATYATRSAATRADRPAGSAGGPVLASKITAPGVPDWAIPRPRITKLIAGAAGPCPLTVVTGPAGAGKTMALASWAAAEAEPVAWVDLDGYDNRPGVFWPYVIAALRRSGVAVPKALTAAARGQAGDHVLLLRLASALAAQNPPVTLVLDDLHLLTGSRLLDGLDYVLRNAGSGLRLVVSSRMDPLLPLHRYRLAGQLAEIRAGDLAFSTAEAALVLAQHGITLSADALQCLIQRTEGWPAGIRLAALSMGTHPDPGQFVKDLAAEDSAVTGYLVEEVLNAQPSRIRDVLLSTSILEQVSADAARELTGHEQAGQILTALAHANAFVQPVGGGWYRYHPLFADVLRLKLRREHPGRVAGLHRRAARWYEQDGSLADAVRHAAAAGDWPLAARVVVDGLAIGEITEPRDGQSLADHFQGMPHRQAWTEPEPHLVLAAAALSAGRPESSATALETAEGILEHLPVGRGAAGCLAAAMIRLTTARRTGDLTAAAAAIDRAEALADMVGRDHLAGHPEIRARVLFGRGVVELWSGRLDEARRVLDSGVAAATAAGEEHERADCLGYLALVEALHGRLGRATRLAAETTAALPADEHPPRARHSNPASLVALAWVHLERGEPREARRLLKQADTALGAIPDKIIGAIACLAAAHGALANGDAQLATRIVARARSTGPVPAWLDQRLSLAESRAFTAAGDTGAALAAARRAGGDDSPEAAVTLAHAWMAAGDGASARRALEPAQAARDGAPERVRLQAWLADAQIRYHSGDRAHGRRSLAAALRLAEAEQLRLPFVMERSWIGPVLRHDPALGDAHRRLLAPALRQGQRPAAPSVPDPPPTPLVIEPLTERERDVLRHFSGMLNTAEVASELYISVNTVKTHLKSIYRKLSATHCGEAVRRARQLELI